MTLCSSQLLFRLQELTPDWLQFLFRLQELTPDWLQFLEFHCHHADHSSWNLIAITQITVPGIDAVGTRLCQHFEL